MHRAYYDRNYTRAELDAERDAEEDAELEDMDYEDAQARVQAEQEGGNACLPPTSEPEAQPYFGLSTGTLTLGAINGPPATWPPPFRTPPPALRPSTIGLEEVLPGQEAGAPARHQQYSVEGRPPTQQAGRARPSPEALATKEELARLRGSSPGRLPRRGLAAGAAAAGAAGAGLAPS